MLSKFRLNVTAVTAVAACNDEATRSRKRNTTPARAIPKSRSATSCRIAACLAYGVIGKIEEAYFKMINDQGGINGRKINFITYDDGYSPPKASNARKLVGTTKSCSCSDRSARRRTPRSRST